MAKVTGSWLFWHMHKELIPWEDMCLNSVVAPFRSSLCMYIFLMYNIFFLIACFVISSLEVTFQIDLGPRHMAFTLNYFYNTTPCSSVDSKFRHTLNIFLTFITILKFFIIFFSYFWYILVFLSNYHDSLNLWIGPILMGLQNHGINVPVKFCGLCLNHFVGCELSS